MPVLEFLPCLAVQGIDTIRGVNDPLQPSVDVGLLFQTVAKGDSAKAGKLFVMQTEQKALLGCGPAYATPCDGDEQLLFTNNGTETFIGRDSFEVIGGIDFMNADASVLTQDFSVLKVASSNALVGTRNGPSGALVWLPGQATPIHDHVSWCVVGVYEGNEYETLYQRDKDTDGTEYLVEDGVKTCPTGTTEALTPPGDIHKVENQGDCLAISLHIYGADICKLGSSIRRSYDLPVR